MKTVLEQDITDSLPPVRGRITENAPLGAMGWFKTGGTADVLFKPADLDDLVDFLRGLPPEIPVQTFGVISNCIIRDGGVRGVTIRLGREFTKIDIQEGYRISAGALALDNSVALAASNAGIAGLEFYSGIPGTIGGALRMNAGCYGTETKDVLVEATALDRQGNIHILKPSLSSPLPFLVSSLRKQGSGCPPAPCSPDPCFRRDDNEGGGGNVEIMNMSYRHNDLPEDYTFIGATFQGREGDPEKIKAHRDEIKQRREQSQPIRERTGGSTFANPSVAELTKAGLPEDTKVWQLIDKAGCRGLMVGGAQMSEKHCNFMINTGTATADDLENLGEEVRRRVAQTHGITLRWEIKRIGERLK